MKILEIRDSATFIPVMAFETKSTDKQESYLLRRAGFSPFSNLIALYWIEADRCSYDPHDWGVGGTMNVAHNYITEHWNEIRSGDVIDVEFILGKTLNKKISESCLEEKQC